jgi:DNA-binding response OmpR family regulator
MPKLNGLEVLARSRLLSTDVPLILISAQFSKDALIEAISLGV